VTTFPPQAAGGQRPASGRPVRRSDAVVDDMVESIVSGVLPVGSLIARESSLCASYDVSRTVVREAVKALEEKGLVTAYQGVGTVVSSQDAWNQLDPIVLSAIVRHDEQYDVLDQLIAVRSAMESHMVAEAARRATAKDIRELEELMTELDSLVSQPHLMDDVDVAFHQRIMLVSGNTLGRAIVRTVHAEARRSMRYLGHSSVGDRKLTNSQHRAVLDAIVQGDADSASALMAAHIGNAWERRKPSKRGRRTS
jgi:GntR family transcriptional regulator, galactonate operon transcriptional repressor